jgi:hypothetical protein
LVFAELSDEVTGCIKLGATWEMELMLMPSVEQVKDQTGRLQTKSFDLELAPRIDQRQIFGGH